MARKPDYRYNIVKKAGEPVSVTLFYGGEDHVATTAHPNFELILKAIRRGDSARKVIGLFDTYATLGERFKAAVRNVFTKTPSGMPPSPDRPSERGKRERVRRVSEKVTIKGHAVLYDGEQVHGALADTIAKFFLEGNRDFAPLAFFLEKIMANPNEHSRKQLFTWLRHLSFHITDDGDFLAYKYLRADYKSQAAGVGIVNGKKVNGQLDNSIGNTVEMPRSMVTHDPKVHCARGLHVGTRMFVGNGGPKIVLVKVNPKDVVSVPEDSNGQKLRVCKYVVLMDAPQKSLDKVFAGAVSA